MKTEDLQRLLYLIESESKRISEILVLIHDTEIKKSFVLENEYDITKDSNFKEALSIRYTTGGTSHEPVFKYIKNMNIKDTSEIFYISFSDNYSDIEEIFKNYPIMRNITNYWVCTENNPVKVPGTNIQMF
jgi:predicted metal-dependent peptidase